MSQLTRWALFLTVGLLLAPPHIGAQTVLSIRGGANLATLGGSDVDGADSRAGIGFGGAVTFGVSTNLGIQIGGGFSQKGATETEQGVDIKFALDYIEVPVLLRLEVPSTGSISPHFVVGPAFSVEVGCTVEGSSQGVTASVACSEADVATKSIDVGVMAGAGLDFDTSGSISVTLDVAYNLGLTTIDDSSPSNDVKNRTWSILAGIAIPIG